MKIVTQRKAIIVGLTVLLIVAYFQFSNFKNQESTDYSGRYQNIYVGNDQPDWNKEDFSAVKKYAEQENLPPNLGLIVELNKYPNQEPSKKQLESAWKLYNNSFHVAEKNKWFNMTKGFEDGYRNWKYDRIHFPNTNYTKDNNTLNPEKPEFLMYYPDPKNNSNPILAGVMYQTDKIKKDGKQVGGPITKWHYHYYRGNACTNHIGSLGLGIVKSQLGGCPDSANITETSYQMLHVWFIKHPETQFATDMKLPNRMIARGPEKLTKEEFYRKHDNTK